MGLALEIVSLRGVEYFADDIERVVVRRRELLHDPGSEIAICAHHAPLLMQMQACRMRISCGGTTIEREVPSGVLEVHDDRVTIALT